MLETKRTINGKQLFYRAGGSGPCVVLLHGFGETGAIWEPQLPALGSYRIIVPDLPGSGQSEMTDDMSMEGLAATIRQLLEELGIDTCALIGHSMGGYIALAFWEKYPEMVNAIGLFHSTAFADSEEKKATRQKGIAFMEKQGAQLFLETATTNLYSPASQEQHPEWIKKHLSLVADAQVAALTAYYRSMMKRPDRSFLLEQNKIPVLFVLGRYDMAVPAADGFRQAHLPAIAYVHLLESSGHMGMWEESEESNRILQAFLASVHTPFT